MDVLKKNNDLGLLIIRLSIGGLMLLHGIFKIGHGVGFIEQMIVDMGLPSFFAYGVYIGEVVASILIILGYATRIAAVVFAINCLVAALMVNPGGFLELDDVGAWGKELLGLYFFGALALIFTGGGKYALSNKHIWD